MQGVELLLLHPRIAARDCTDCLRYLYDEKRGVPVLRGGEPMLRIAASPPPCRTPSGCPKGSPESSKALTPENVAAYTHYRRCRAVGQFPDDEIVKMHAQIIRDVEDTAERLERIKLMQLMMTR